jgi:hypothetical protein
VQQCAGATRRIEPRKASHTAVAINAAEEPLGELQVAGERVLDVPPKVLDHRQDARAASRASRHGAPAVPQ